MIEQTWAINASPLILLGKINQNVPISILNWDIGAGESQVLAYCLKYQGCKAILDDGQARAAAQSHRIQLLGTLGIIIRAKRSGLIAAAQPLIEQLVINGSYLSPSLIQAALLNVDEEQ